MFVKLSIALQLCFVTSVAGGWMSQTRPSVCYGRWGCFSIRPPFMNTGHLPQSPARLGVQFFLYARNQPRVRLDLDWSNERMREVFDVTKDTRVIVHGYRDNGDDPRVQAMAAELLERADQNVVIVDWGRGARSVNYLQVAANTRLVAAMVAAMLQKWVEMGVPTSSFHLIGISLGAHIAGYVGSRVAGIGRITGLDPAGPSFENMTPAVRLDPTDAVFVDVIHSNSVPIDQMDAIRTIACSHMRATDYFTDSINSQCAMDATPCHYPQVLRERNYCASRRWTQHHCQDCVTMGYDVDPNASGVYYVRTGSRAPYCVH